METVGRRWDRLVALLFLAIVGVAVVLLVAGYGVAVGVGAIAGLLLGFLAGALGLLWLARGSGRSITFGTEWSSGSGGPTAGLMAEMRELGEVSGVDLGGIRAVVPMLTTAEAGGLAVQLVSVEIHEAGLVMTLDGRSGPGVLPPAQMARVSVTDDAGTAYRAAAQAVGGSPGQVRYALTAIPIPPPEATRLDIAIERFIDPFSGGPPSAIGPWTFSLALPGGGKWSGQ